MTTTSTTYTKVRDTKLGFIEGGYTVSYPATIWRNDLTGKWHATTTPEWGDDVLHPGQIRSIMPGDGSWICGGNTDAAITYVSTGYSPSTIRRYERAARTN